MGPLQPPRRSAHTPQTRVLRLLPRESARWRIRVCAHANAGCLLEAAAGTSEQGRAPRERAVSMAQWASMGHGLTLVSGGAARARRKRACCASSRERVRGSAFACAHTRTLAGRRRPRLARRSMSVHRGRGPSRWRSGLPTSTYHSDQCGAARARRKRACCASSRERTWWRVRVCVHANAVCSSEATAGTSERGRAPKERAF